MSASCGLAVGAYGDVLYAKLAGRRGGVLISWDKGLHQWSWSRWLEGESGQDEVGGGLVGEAHEGRAVRIMYMRWCRQVGSGSNAHLSLEFWGLSALG